MTTKTVFLFVCCCCWFFGLFWGGREEFYDQLQNVIDQTLKKDILVVQGDWNAKVARDACGNWQGICRPFCNDDANERELKTSGVCHL